MPFSIEVAGLKKNVAYQIFDIGTCREHIAGPHRQHFLDRGSAELLL
jgi:hypothetical protein